MKRKSIFLIILSMILCLTIVIMASGCGRQGGVESQSEDAYEPALKITGDVENVISIKPDGSGTDVTSEKARAAGENRDGWRLGTLIEEAIPYTEDSTVYIQGLDGMMASISLKELDTNWLVFGKNGWECVSDGYPDSLDVKEISQVVVVADDPSAVPTSVSVMADDGIERIISAGTLYIKDYTGSIEWQGESKKNEKNVTVLLTDRKVKVGETTLKPDGNKIIIE